MSAGEKYVAAAYLVVFLAVLVWVAIVAAKLARLERELGELTELAKRKRESVAAAEREVTSVG
jgi:CcmD family protein